MPARSPTILLGVFLAVTGCGSEPVDCSPSWQGQVREPQSVVLILVDDLGVDKVGAYGVSPSPAPTPRIDALAAQGVLFRSAYAEPVCSSARASLLTGRRPVRTGIGSTVRPDDDPALDLPERERTLPEVLRDRAEPPRATFAVGKWHLTSLDDPEVASAPLRHGFDHFDGVLSNPTAAVVEDGAKRGYNHWERDQDGVLSYSDQYLVTAQADAAIAALEALPDPFFLYVSFSGVHEPYHLPPAELWSGEDPVDEPGLGDAMIAALDHEVGRLLDAIGDRAIVFLTSDNGTSPDLVRPPADPRRAKLTVYPGGTRVPLIVAGPGVEPGEEPGLAHVTDLFPTVLELQGVPVDDLAVELDGRSLVPALERSPDPGRRCVIVEQFWPNVDPRGDPVDPPRGDHDVAILDRDFVLVRREGGADELYLRDPTSVVDGPDLLTTPREDRPDGVHAEARRLGRWLRANDP